MTPTNKRNLMLATSGLMGLAGLASLTLGVNSANAACTLSSGVLVCDASDPTTDDAVEISTTAANSIATQAGPDLSVLISAGTVDTTVQPITVLPAKFTGAVVFTNAATIGKKDAVATTFAATSNGVSITGDATKTTNSITFTNSGPVYGTVTITNAGGAATANINGDVITKSNGTGGKVDIIDAIGGATVITATGVTVGGGITADSQTAPVAAVPVINGTVTTTTTSAAGGKASVTLGGNVGWTTPGVGFNVNTGQPNPDVFTSSAVTATGATGADILQNAGKAGALTASSTWTKTVSAVDTGSGSPTTSSTTTTTSGGGGNVTLTQIAGASTDGAVSLTADGNVTVDVAGALASSGTAGKAVAITAGATPTVVTIASKTDSAVPIKIADTNSTKTTQSAATASVTVQAGASIGSATKADTVTVTAPGGITVASAGAINGSLTLNGGAINSFSGTTNTYEDGVGNGKQLTAVGTVTNTNVSKAVTLTLTGKGAVTGATTINSGGTVVVDTATGTRTNAISINNAPASDFSQVTVFTLDKTGPIISTVQDQSSKATGGAITLNLAGNAVTSTLTNTPASVSATGQDDITAKITAPIIGNVALTATAFDFTQKFVSLTPISGGSTTTIKQSTVASGGAVTVTVAAGSTVGDKTGTAVQIIADKASSLTNDGVLAGGASINTNSQTLATQNDTLNSVITTTPVANQTIITTTATADSVVATQGGAATLSNTAKALILGNTTVTALGDVTYTNAGFSSGNVTLTSSGSSVTTTTANKSVDEEDPVGALVLADAKVFKTDVTNSTKVVTTATGGSVVGVYSGISGEDNDIIAGVTPGTAITQTANKDSTATVSGTVFTDVTSTGGTNNKVDTTTFTSNLTKNFDKNNPGTLLLLASGSGFDTTVVDKVSTANLGVSKVVVSGSIAADAFGGSSNVTSTGQGSSTVTVTGAVLNGGVQSTASATNSTETTTTTNTKRFVAATTTTPAEIGTQIGKTDILKVSSTTIVGGASTVDATGKATLTGATVGGSILSTGNTKSTVTVGGDARVTGDVTSTVTGADTTSSTKQAQVRGLTGTWTETFAETKTKTVSKASSDAVVTVAAPTQSTIPTGVGGDVNANALTGAATATIANQVGGSVNAVSLATNSSKVENKVFTATSQVNLADPTKTTPVSNDQTTTDTDVGGKATITIAAVAALTSKGIPVVAGNVTAVGASAQVDLAAGASVGGTIQTVGLLETESTKDVNTFTTGASNTTNHTETFTAVLGASTINVNGKVGGNAEAFGSPATVNVAATGFVSGDAGANAMYTNEVFNVVGVNLATPLTLSQTTTDTLTAQTGTVATADNKGIVLGDLFALGAKATVNNAVAAYTGGIQVGDFGPSNYTRTTIFTAGTTKDSIAATLVAGKLYVESSTVNQSGFVDTGGIFAASGFITNPIDGSSLQVLDHQATFNLNSGSVTGGYIGGDYNPLTNAYFTTTNVNLVGSGFVGWDGVNQVDVAANRDSYDVFAAAPTLTKDQVKYSSGSQSATIEGATAVTHTGPGTFYILGEHHTDDFTPTRFDETFAIRAKTFTNTSGRLEFATDEDLSGGGNDDVFGIMANVSNSGDFVVGRTHPEAIVPNLSSLLNTQTLVDGQKFLVVGDFAQTTSGSLIIGGTPDLLRVSDLGVGGAGANEILGFFPYTVGAGPFTVASNAFTLDDSHISVEGNVNLAGKIVIGNQRGGLQADGQVQELFDVSGTFTSTATVAPLFSSNFVTYTVGTTKASNGHTLVNVTTARTSFTSVAGNDNATAALAALDSAVAPTIKAIQDDANGVAVFPSVQRFREVQDIANTIAGFDWVLGQPELAAAGDELSQGEFFGSLNGYDTTRQFVGAMAMGGTDSDAPATIWVTPSYRTTTIDGDTNTGSGEIKVGEAGLFAGGAFRVNDMWGFGLGAGYQSADVDGEDKPVSADVTTFLVGADGWWRSGPIRLGGGLAYGVSNINTLRHMSIFARDVTADYDSQSLVVNLDGSYDFENVLGGTVTPYLHVGIRNVSTDGFRESLDGGGLALVVDKVSETQTTPVLGVTWKGMDWNWGVGSVSPHAGLAVVFNDYASETTQAFVGGGDKFTLQGVDPSTHGELSAGFTGKLGDMGSFSVDGAALFGDVSGGSISATLRLLLGK